MLWCWQVGYGDITPTNDLERLYTLATLLIGALVFSYLLSSVGSLIATLDSRYTMVEEKLDQLQEVILHEGLPAELASRVRSCSRTAATKPWILVATQALP